MGASDAPLKPVFSGHRFRVDFVTGASGANSDDSRHGTCPACLVGLRPHHLNCLVHEITSTKGFAGRRGAGRPSRRADLDQGERRRDLLGAARPDQPPTSTDRPSGRPSRSSASNEFCSMEQMSPPLVGRPHLPGRPPSSAGLSEIRTTSFREPNKPVSIFFLRSARRQVFHTLPAIVIQSRRIRSGVKP